MIYLVPYFANIALILLFLLLYTTIYKYFLVPLIILLLLKIGLSGCKTTLLIISFLGNDSFCQAYSC
jgi:hypothetical protein